MARIITKLYLYDASKEDDNYRGYDFSDYICMGDSETDDLTEILDVVNLTLADLPFSQEFEPKTKFILEKWEEGMSAMWKDWHLCVARDVVSQPVLSDNKRFDHTITFNEASVDSQGRLVDNIAVTYRLKDVSLESKPTYDVNAKAIIKKSNVNHAPPSNYGYTNPPFSGSVTMGHRFMWVFPDWYNVTIDGTTKTPASFDWNNIKLNQEIANDTNSRTITIPTPMLECASSIAGTKNYQKNGYCSIDIVVNELNIATNQRRNIEINGETTVLRVNPTNSNNNEKWVSDSMYSGLNYGYIASRPRPHNGKLSVGGTIPIVGMPGFSYNFSKVAESDSVISNRTISFVIKPGCQYTVTATRRAFDRPSRDINIVGDAPGVHYDDWYDKEPAYYGYGKYTNYVLIATTDEDADYINSSSTRFTLTFNAVLEGENVNLYLRNAPAENAYNLYNKALTTTQNIIKQRGVPIDETPKTYYLEDKDKQELTNTIVVENFYNQKNWWELQQDIGKYIHAIPKVRFGSNDRFVTTWKKLGDTSKQEEYGNTLSIFNSKNVEEYIAATSSYVSNMVQLGGIIDEWVSAKSSSSDYLVYNDNAEIILSRNIIELVDMDVKYIGENKSNMNLTKDSVRNMVGKGMHGESTNGYIFGKDVYNVLPVIANTSVNKGIAIYYTLGSNKIEGLNYRLPSINPGTADTEYAIKRIIGTIFNIPTAVWSQIIVNDFLFHVKYRTKDTLRVNQVRPDLHKYLVTSKHDRVPQHHQFNNQTDTVVDSVKFGNNIYGKLIRTGNTVYTKTEWVDSLYKLKQAGELYEIRGNVYYVAKVKNTYYHDHIISEIEFSKDFNRLSQIIGIPSEPRFYEISEQSQINRQVVFDDYIVVGTSINPQNNDSFIKNGGWEYIANLLLGSESTYPKYAVTVFKNDIEKETITGNESFYVEVCSFVGGYSIQNTLTLSWNMVDNFSAGDQKENTQNSVSNNIDGRYATLLPFRYTDVYGRADLVDFAIVKDYNISNDNVMLLPANPIDIKSAGDNYIFGNEQVAEWGDNYHGIGLLKDNREALSFNYNLQTMTDSHRFVLSAYMWQLGKENLKIALLSDEVNKISNDTIPDSIITTQLYDLSYSVLSNGVRVNIASVLRGVDMEEIKSIAIISTNEVNDYYKSGAKYFVMARNIADLDENDKISDWYISSIDKLQFYTNTKILENLS